MADIVVHHLEKSRSHRVLWLIEELGHDYELRTYHRHPKTMRAGDDLKRIHPLGRSPVVEIDGQVYAESGAILEELVDRLDDGTMRPEPGTEAFRHYRFFLHYAEGSMMPPLLVALLTHKVRTAKLPFFLRPVVRSVADRIDGSYTEEQLDTHLSFVDAHLAENTWFCGDELTAADVQMCYPMEGAMVRANAAKRPHMAAWLERARARPAYQRALEKGGELIPGR